MVYTTDKLFEVKMNIIQPMIEQHYVDRNIYGKMGQSLINILTQVLFNQHKFRIGCK